MIYASTITDPVDHRSPPIYHPDIPFEIDWHSNHIDFRVERAYFNQDIQAAMNDIALLITANINQGVINPPSYRYGYPTRIFDGVTCFGDHKNDYSVFIEFESKGDIQLNLKGDLSQYGTTTKQGPLYEVGPKLLVTEQRVVGRLEDSEAIHETLVGVRFQMPSDYEQRAIEESTRFGYWLLKTLLPSEEVHQTVDDLPTFTISPEWITSMRECLNLEFAASEEVAVAFYLRRQASGLIMSWRAQAVPKGVLWIIRDRDVMLENRRADEDVLLFHRWFTPGKSDPVPHLTEELWMVTDTKKRRKKDDREAFTQRQLVWMGH